MNCEICSRSDVADIGLYCASCARTSIYLARVEAARVLLEKEKLGRSIDSVVEAQQGVDQDAALHTISRTWSAECTNSKAIKVREDVGDKRSHISALEADLMKMRAEISQRKISLAAKRKDWETIETQVPARQRTSLDKVSDVGVRGSLSFDNLHSKSVDTKALLCREAASLMRFKQKKRMKSGVLRDQYSIAGLLLPDFRDVNGLRCTDMTAALTGVAHLLVLVSFYLGVRLPAEITLPHRDYPLATINTPATSYSGRKPQFPGSGSNMSIPVSPTTSRHDGKPLPRPRPLFIGSDDREEKVAQFAKKDAPAFSFFVEAISLLAWNVSWLCHSQGFKVGTDSWEDVCDIGRNLYQLIYVPRQSPAMLRALSNKDFSQRQKNARDTPSPKSANLDAMGRLGELSHTSAHSFLGAQTREQSRGWRLSVYTTIADPLKKALVTEMNNAEWEILEEGEYDDGAEQFDDAVHIKARAMDVKDIDDARSIITTKTALTDGLDGASTDGGRIRGTKGWTKVKNRTVPDSRHPSE